MSGEQPLVDVADLVKSYGPLRAIDGLSFQVRRGEIVGLLGANGAGKSTLMKVLNCYLTADGGTAKVAGVSVDDDPVLVRNNIGYLPENAPLYTEMRVKDFLHFAGRMRGLGGTTRQSKIDWAIEACGLQAKYMAIIGTLSRGYRQRVGLAQSILHDPDLLILDEPTSGLDPIQLIEIRRLIMEIGKEKTVFFSTHIMQEVEAVCNRAIIIAKGRLVADGTPTDLKTRFADKGSLVAKLRGVEEKALSEAAKSLPGISSVEVRHLPDMALVECMLRVGGSGATNAKALNEIGQKFLALSAERGWNVLEMHAEGVSLEDAFLRASGGIYHKEKSINAHLGVSDSEAETAMASAESKVQ
jgi:ABC-2 type transport system ATP-binding protein